MSLRFQRAELISTIIIIGFFLSVCFHYTAHFYFQRPYPYSTFLSWPTDHHTDYTRVADAAKSWNPYRYRVAAFHGPHGDQFPNVHGGEVGNYLPFTYIVALAFTVAPHGIFLFFGLFLAGLAWYFVRRSGIGADPHIPPVAKVRLVFVLTLMSYPVLWEIDRGNFEGVTFLLMAAGAALIGRSKYSLAAIPLALAIAMKGYPAIFLALYLPDKKYREAAFAAVLSVAVCLAGFAVLHGGLVQNIQSLKTDLAFFLDYYVIHGAGTAGTRMDCSLFAPVGLLNSNPAFIRHALLYYNGFALVAGALLVWLIAARRMERWKLEYLLAAAGLLLPSISYDYKLLVLFIPLTSFLSSARRERTDAFYCASFGAMLIPKDYLFLGSGVSIANGVSISSLLEPLILLATVAVIVRDVLARGAQKEALPDGGREEAPGGKQWSRQP
jgi:hypothetical protein